jgi:hypothetical protein
VADGGLPDYLFVARDNAYGLTRDVELLRNALEAGGATTAFATVRRRGVLGRLLRRKAARCIVHVERAFPAWFSAGDENWLVPNQERFPRRHVGRLRRIDRVLAKSHHAQAIFAALGPRTDFLGFTSPDRFDPVVAKDWSGFFHLAGGSTLKGTEEVLALWARHPRWPTLTLVQKAENAPASVPANVRLLSGYLSDEELRALQNRCGLHLCPSRAEGWGHHIVEGLSVGAVVVTTDAPPMNELVRPDCGLLVPVSSQEPRHLGTSFHVDGEALRRTVEAVIAMPDAEKAAMGQAARQRYLEIDAGYRARAAAIFR